MEKQKIIWSSEINLDDWDDLKEEEPDISENKLYECAEEINNGYLEDMKEMLDIPMDTEIVCVADLGLWDGRIMAAKVEGMNVNQIFKSNVTGDSEQEWYFDGKNICGREAHHDGTNYYTYRKMKPGKSFNTFIRQRPTYKRMLQYTTSIAPEVKKVFGW